MRISDWSSGVCSSDLLQRRYEVGVVIDAASSLGTIDAAGKGFGAEAPFATVFSMHATKTFAVAEGGLVHSGDAGLIDRLRAMINFGFQGQRRSEEHTSELQ